MEQVLNNNNNLIATKSLIEKEKNKTTNKSNIANRILRKICVQIIICTIIITSIYFYKKYSFNSFEYINSKYNWIVKYNMTYSSMYNSFVSFLNEKFAFKIPLKEEKNNEQNNIVLDNEINNNIIEEEIIEETKEEAILTSTGYDNMRIMADEIKHKYSWSIPTIGKITSPFGVRDPSRPDISSFHMGIDLANSEGTELVAAIDGEIIEATYNNVYGNYIKISKDDVIIIYAHCSKLLVKKNESVKAGEKIALMGSTGISTGPHLHFEIRKDNQVINPEYILNLR